MRRAAAADRAGLHCALAFPIFADDDLYAVVELFNDEACAPDDELLETIETVASQIGEFVEAERREAELAFQKALLESQGEAAIDGILLVSAEQRVLYWNSRFVEMWDVAEDVLERGDAFEVNEHLAPKAADPAIFDEIADAIRQDPALTRRDQIALADGRIFDRWAAPVLAPDGARLGRTVFYRDITEQKRAEDRLRLNEEWTSFLSETSALLSQSLDVETIVQRLADLAVMSLADWCSIYIVDEGGVPRPLAVAHVDPTKVRIAQEIQENYPPDPRQETGVFGVIRSGSPLLMSDIPEDVVLEAAQDERHLEVLRSLQLRSAMVVPLIARDRVLGAITFVSAESERTYTDEDLVRAQELAARAAPPIDNARLYAETRLVAQTLQKSFLPPALPDIPGVDISARYYPAGEGIEIGGDFYDAFRIGNKRWGLALGDVSGKGLEAATVTTLARHTIRGAALTAERPSDVLRIVNAALVEQQQTDRFCTVVYTTVEPRFARMRVTVACGGHPAPYVIRNDGTVEPIAVGGTLLGFIEDVTLEDVTVELEFGDKLFLYTDGVLDIRRKGGMFGAEGLEKLLYECVKRGTEAAADHIARTLLDAQQGEPTDDIAYILVGVRSSVFNIRRKRTGEPVLISRNGD